METNVAINSVAPSRRDEPDPMREAIAQVFSAFARLFGHKWERTFNDSLARAAWLATLRHARVGPDQIRAGLANASQLQWPPSAGEFAGLCTPPAPSDRDAYREALARARGVEVPWSHPAIGAAYLDVGAWQLRSASDREAFSVFAISYRQMRERYGRGEELAKPSIRALPAEVRNRPASDGTVARELAACMAALGLGASHG